MILVDLKAMNWHSSAGSSGAEERGIYNRCADNRSADDIGAENSEESLL